MEAGQKTEVIITGPFYINQKPTKNFKNRFKGVFMAGGGSSCFSLFLGGCAPRVLLYLAGGGSSGFSLFLGGCAPRVLLYLNALPNTQS